MSDGPDWNYLEIQASSVAVRDQEKNEPSILSLQSTHPEALLIDFYIFQGFQFNLYQFCGFVRTGLFQ